MTGFGGIFGAAGVTHPALPFCWSDPVFSPWGRTLLTIVVKWSSTITIDLNDVKLVVKRYVNSKRLDTLLFEREELVVNW